MTRRTLTEIMVQWKQDLYASQQAPQKTPMDRMDYASPQYTVGELQPGWALSSMLRKYEMFEDGTIRSRIFKRILKPVHTRDGARYFLDMDNGYKRRIPKETVESWFYPEGLPVMQDA